MYYIRILKRFFYREDVEDFKEVFRDFKAVSAEKTGRSWAIGTEIIGGCPELSVCGRFEKSFDFRKSLARKN